MPDHASDIAYAERLVIAAEYLSGATPEGMIRPMFPWEVRSRIDFAAKDRRMTAAAQDTVKIINDCRDTIIGLITTAIGDYNDPGEAYAVIVQFIQQQPPAVAAELAKSEEAIAAVLEDLFASELQAQIDAADEQDGVDDPELAYQIEALQATHRDTPVYGLYTRATIVTIVTRLQAAAATAPRSRVSGPTGGAPGSPGGIPRPSGTVGSPNAPAAGQPGSPQGSGPLAGIGTGAALRDITAPDIIGSMRSASMAAAYDLGRQAVNIAAGDGLAAALNALPAPSSIYASELLDGRTCGPCLQVDGREYDTLADAYEDYPRGGVYVNCAGGDRCRGTLVATYE